MPGTHLPNQVTRFKSREKRNFTFTKTAEKQLTTIVPPDHPRAALKVCALVVAYNTRYFLGVELTIIAPLGTFFSLFFEEEKAI